MIGKNVWYIIDGKIYAGFVAFDILVNGEKQMGIALPGNQIRAISKTFETKAEAEASIDKHVWFVASGWVRSGRVKGEDSNGLVIIEDEFGRIHSAKSTVDTKQEAVSQIQETRRKNGSDMIGKKVWYIVDNYVFTGTVVCSIIVEGNHLFGVGTNPESLRALRQSELFHSKEKANKVAGELTFARDKKAARQKIKDAEAELETFCRSHNDR